MKDKEMAILLPVAAIKMRCNPYGRNLWGAGVLRMKHVQEALDTGIWEQAYAPKTKVRPFLQLGNKYEAARIAFFVKRPANDAISIDVGIPTLGQFECWPVTDGNHRLAAAIFSKTEHILADVSGDLGFARMLFGVDCREVKAAA
jgi:hypothetical protein